jgi:hypothetical protein
MTIYFIDDERQQAEMFKCKILKMFGGAIKVVWLDHWFKISSLKFTTTESFVVVLDYYFANGFRSGLAFDEVGELDTQVYLYTTAAKGEVLRDIKKLNCRWPDNMEYINKSDHKIFRKIATKFKKIV